MNVKILENVKLNISHKFTKAEEEDKIDVNTDNYQPRNRSYSRDQNNSLIEAEEIMIGPIDLVIEVE